MPQYNGWSSYETWRVNLEVFDGYETDDPMTGDACKDYVEELVSESLRDENSLVSGWLNGFLSEVNWQEIADAINDANGLTDEDPDQ